MDGGDLRDALLAIKEACDEIVSFYADRRTGVGFDPKTGHPVYRDSTNDGCVNRCPVGILIDDSIYKSNAHVIEGRTVMATAHVTNLPSERKLSMDFLASLQIAHDSNFRQGKQKVIEAVGKAAAKEVQNILHRHGVK